MKGEEREGREEGGGVRAFKAGAAPFSAAVEREQEGKEERETVEEREREKEKDRERGAKGGFCAVSENAAGETQQGY